MCIDRSVKHGCFNGSRRISMKLIVIMILGFSGFASDISEEGLSSCVEKSLELFAPIVKFVLCIDKPASKAVVSLYERESAKSRNNKIRLWKKQGEIKELRGLLPGLYDMKKAYLSEDSKQIFNLPGLSEGVDMRGLWLEILQKACGILGGYASIAKVAMIMEDVGVDNHNITAFCAHYVGAVAHNNFRSFLPANPEKGTTLYKIYHGQNIEDSVIQLLQHVQLPKEKQISDSILRYINFLDWQGGANWWEVFRALQKAEELFAQSNSSALDLLWCKFFREDSRGKELCINESLTLAECMQESKKEGWECPHFVMCAAADLPHEVLMDLQGKDQDQYDFWCRCQGVYLAKAQSALAIFDPVASRTVTKARRACAALQSLYSKAKKLADSQKVDLLWQSSPEIKSPQQLCKGLQELALSCEKQGKESFDWPGRLFGAEMDKIFMIVRLEEQSLCDVIEITSLMEKMGVNSDFVLQYCLFSAEAVRNVTKEKFFHTDDRLDPEAPAYKFYHGQNIDSFVSQVVLHEKGRGFLHWSTEKHLQSYRQYLSWKGSVNWWDFLLGLYKGGASQRGRFSDIFTHVRKSLQKETVDFDKALAYLRDTLKSKYDSGLMQEAMEEVVRCLVQGRKGVSALWKGRGEIRTIDMFKVSQIIETLRKQKQTARFFEFVIQSLPTDFMLQHCGGAQTLGDLLYKKVFQGVVAVYFLKKMLSVEMSDKEQERAERNASSYVSYLWNKLSFSDWLEVYNSVASMENGRAIILADCDETQYCTGPLGCEGVLFSGFCVTMGFWRKGL